MSNIPAEYSNVDFGFSAVDEAEFKSNQAEAESTPPSIDENDINRIVLNSLAPLEDKIDLLLQRRQAEESDDVQLAIAQAQDEVAGKVTELEKIIMPLLVNLTQDCRQRVSTLAKSSTIKFKLQIDKVLALTRG
jgi:hypothetical protein